ncbi:hypothetical protein DL93DRAFT_1434870 [Clavulina sp. PMI_390]|nr:hypothetical protein DL93DRAFT_1434870 [Clavulina sp. PMI_390]
MQTLSERSLDWIKEHRLAVSIAGVAVIGALGYTAYNLNATHGRLSGLRRRAAQRKGKGHATSASAATAAPERDIVIILGADSVPCGPSVVRDFQKNGYIVLASVFSGEAADDLERDTEGYVRALVLDAEEAGSIPHFLRSLSSTLSLRFPTTIHGDPYQSMTSSQSTSLARVTSVISFLSLGQAELLPFNNFSSPITFSESYTHQFMTRALSPLAILNATLPLFRHRKTIGSPRESSSSTSRRYGASVILCVPAAARVGVLGSSSHSMANHAVAQGFRILRREAALDPLLEGTDLRFVTIDVGEFADPAEIKRIGAQRKEKGVSGRRIPTDVRVLSKTLMSIVDASRRPWSLDWMKMVVMGTRRSVGAGGMCFMIWLQDLLAFTLSPN